MIVLFINLSLLDTKLKVSREMLAFTFLSLVNFRSLQTAKVSLFPCRLLIHQNIAFIQMHPHICAVLCAESAQTIQFWKLNKTKC